MSVDVKDHRRYAEGKMAEQTRRLEEKIEAEKNLLPQADSDAANTGDSRLDKVIRHVQSEIEKLNAHKLKVSEQGICCVEEKMFRLQQMEYMYTQGKLVTLEAMKKLPEQILMEEKGIPAKVPTANAPEAQA